MTASPALLTKELESAMAKLRFLRDSNDPHLFAKFNNEQATALLQHIAALEQRVEAFESVAVALWMAGMELRRLRAVDGADKAFATLAAYRALPKEPR